MQGRLLAAALCLALLVQLLAEAEGYSVFYQYKRYPYRKKQKQQERRIRNLKSDCENSSECTSQHGVQKMSCVRQCMSATCYEELYAHDEVEEGEIDVRYNSFKGCIADKLRR